MRIDKRLHLVVPIYESNQDVSPIVAQVHSTPIGEAVVDKYFMLLGRTYNAIFSQGLGFAAGPGHAMRVLRHIATESGMWHDDPKTGSVGAERGLVEEIRRLTNVAAADKDGRWSHLPWQIAIDQGIISSEDKIEVENAIVFFIVASATLNRGQREGVLTAAGEIWGAQILSLDFTEWMSSLRTSTATASIGERPRAIAEDSQDHASAGAAKKTRQVPV